MVKSRRVHHAFFYLAAGVPLGALLTVFIIVATLYYIPAWLVVKDQPIPSEAVVTLGGGGASRLRYAISLYDQGVAKELIVVGERKENWDHIIQHLCRDCDLSGKRTTMLYGSKDTVSDAELTLKHCRERGLRTVLVVTDPYYTRRSQMVFHRVFHGSGIQFTVVSDGDFGVLLSPDRRWWRDRRTMETVWLESGKILYYRFLPMPSI